MKELSKIAQSIHPSATVSIDTLFKQMKADGINVIGFGAGEPDFDTPEHIKNAGKAAIDNNETRYTAANGTVELRKAVCRRLKEDCGLEYSPEEICISNGAKSCVYVALRAILNPGDEVIIPAPYWVSYSELVLMCGGVPVLVDAGEQENFKLSTEKFSAAITPKTKALILNNPNNPTGMMYSREELEEIARVCVEQDLYVLCDEIYYRLVYEDAEFVSFPSLGEEIKERTLLVNGVSKSYAMTGWRIGYVAARREIARVIAAYLSHCAGSASTISQRAAVEALTASQDSVEHMRLEFELRRDYMVKRMNHIQGVSCIMPQGAFYVMMSIEKLLGTELHGVVIRNSEDFADLFLKYGKVAVVPGTAFSAPNHVRWSYATSIENIREGLNRLERFLKGETIE